MNLASMTGFSRVAGFSAPFRWSWEIKTVNAKGLDVRLRLPQGFDALEQPARAAIGAVLTRGTCYASLALTREGPTAFARINRELLAGLMADLAAVPRPEGVGPATLDGLLAARGVVEIVEHDEDEATLAAGRAALLAGLDAALRDLRAMRGQEGAALGVVLGEKLDRIAVLTEAANSCPARQPAAVLEKLRAALAQLNEAGRFDEARLYQEAVLLAAKADIREELDRLKTHVVAARKLLAEGGAIGRRLDFLAQEFSRESNTLCAKANDAALTAIGLELKVETEQLREQAQNIE